MTYDYFEEKGIYYCSVFTDKTKSSGVLRFTHEINVTFVYSDEQWKFYDAWHVGVSDMFWKADELDSFEELFPGLLNEMMNGLKEVM